MLLKKIVPKSIKTFIFERKFFLSEVKKGHKKKLKKIALQNKQGTLDYKEKNHWIKQFNKITYANPKLINLGEYFVTDEINIIKDSVINKDDVVAICVEKNDLMKLKKFISHHRALGFNKFIMLDNDSTDGTIVYLMKQDDVILLHTNVTFSSPRHPAWINRIIAHYGYNRWYFVADSDELLVYNDCENKSIQDVIKYCKKNKIIRARSLLLDMYAKSNYYSSNNLNSYYKECIYFDADTYRETKDKKFCPVYGGPRTRIFNINPCLTKYPLFYFRKKDVYINSHYLYPYKNNLNVDCMMVLKHYKFLPGELEKYKNIVSEANFYNGSIEYQHYVKILENDSKIDFKCESTKKYENSKSLDEISIYKKINWK